MDGLIPLLAQPDDPRLASYAENMLQKIVDDWRVAGTKAEPVRLGQYHLAMERLLNFLCKHYQSNAGNLVELLSQDSQPFHRSLYLIRPNVTSPALILLKRLCDFGQVITLFNTFDLSANAIPKLLNAKGELRSNFIEFYCAFIRSAPSALRRDLWGNRKVTNGWIGRIAYDNEHIQLLTIEMLRDCYLRDPSFSKTIKLSFFNDWTLRNTCQLLAIQYSSVREGAASLLFELFADKQYGISFADAGWYSSETRNRHALSFLKILRPWESVIKMDLAVRLLLNFPDLVQPYFESLSAANFSLSPKNSMFWFAYSIFHVRVIGLPAVKLTETPPLASIVADACLPPTATKQNLLAALTFSESLLVNYQTLEIISTSLRKLFSVKCEYESRGWDFHPVKKKVLARLPDIHYFIQPREPFLLQILLLICVRELGKVDPETVLHLALPQSILSVLDTRKIFGPSLLLAKEVLEIQALASLQSRWWNKKQDSASFFTRLVKFATFNPTLSEETARLIELLTSHTLIFCESGVVSPVATMLFTITACVPLMPESEQENLWSLIDEAVSRCARMPFPYIDKLRANVSPIVAAFLEQCTYAGCTGWLKVLLRNLSVIGEDHSTLRSIAEGLPGDFPQLSKEDYFEFVLSAPAQEILQRNDLVFKIGTSLELAATLYRASSDPDLTNFLLACIPEDMVSLLNRPALYRQFLKPSLDSQYFGLLSLHKVQTTDQLSHDLSLCPSWEVAIGFLTDADLIEKYRQTKKPFIVTELTQRKVALPLDLINLSRPDNIVLTRIDDKALALDLMHQTNSIESICALIKVSNIWSEDLPKDIRIQATALKYAQNFSPPNGVLNEAVKSLDGEFGSYAAKIIAEYPHELLEHELQHVDSYLGSTDNVLQLESVQLALAVDGEGRSRWIKKVVLKLTKLVAENKILPIDFITALKPLCPIMWGCVHTSSINALLAGSVMKDVPELMELSARIVTCAPIGKVDKSHLQILLQNSYSQSLERALLIWAFVVQDPSGFSADVQRALVCHYGGTCSVADQVILQALKLLEKTVRQSWAEDVASWESSSYTSGHVIEQLHPTTALRIIFDKARIDMTQRNYDPNAHLDDLPLDYDLALQACESYRVKYASQNYHDEFLLGLVLSLNLDIGSLVSSGLMSITICCLVSDKLNEFAISYLRYISNILAENEDYKDSPALELLVNKLLLFIHKEKNFPAYVPLMAAQLVPIVANPSHLLREKLHDWLLAGPSIQPWEVPMSRIILSTRTESHFREYMWLLHALTSSMVDSHCVSVFAEKGFFEWALSVAQLKSPKADSLRAAVRDFLSKAVRVGGSMTLAEKTGGLQTSARKEIVYATKREDLQSFTAA